ncbi:MAG: hypothetical protein LBQ60_10640 [Bacteroidales bacterium]|jgi:hypothetical protein|nr:hypothetical protein [Bacteroidales bacterium]
MIKLQIFILIGITLIMSCSPKDNKQLNVSDMDTIFLTEPNSGFMFPLSGFTYKAIDIRYVANRYRFTKSIFYSKDGKKESKNSFELIAFSDDRAPALDKLITSLTAAKSWNYYINDQFLIWYSRVLVSVLLPDAIEKVEYIETDPNPVGSVYIYNTPTIEQKEDTVGAVHIYTRDIFRRTTHEKSTLYLLNDIVITKKIFDAINPIYIRSLRRVTGKTELLEYGNKNLEEVVVISTFEHKEIIAPDMILADDSGFSVLLVDGIELSPLMDLALNRYFFKEIQKISLEDDTSSPFKQKYPEKKIITMITLE